MQKARAVTPRLRVVLVDDHEVVRAGLREVVERHRMEVVGEAGEVDEAVRVISETRPDAVILDVLLPGGGGQAVLARIAEGLPVLACSASDERDDVVATVRAGASGYVLKTAPAEDIAAALQATAAGEPVFSPELAGHLLDADLSAQADAVDDARWQDLTEREREVLRLLARGRTYRRIGEELHVATKTVETHVRHILHKLQVTNRHEAARWAIDRNLG